MCVCVCVCGGWVSWCGWVGVMVCPSEDVCGCGCEREGAFECAASVGVWADACLYVDVWVWVGGRVGRRVRACAL